MTVLRAARKLQIAIGVFSENFTGLWKDFFTSFRSIFFITGMIIVMVVSSVAYLYYNFTDISTSTNALIILMAGGAGLGGYIGTGINMKKLKIMYNTLERIVEDGIINCSFMSIFIINLIFMKKNSSNCFKKRKFISRSMLTKKLKKKAIFWPYGSRHSFFGHSRLEFLWFHLHCHFMKCTLATTTHLHGLSPFTIITCFRSMPLPYPVGI